MSTHLERTFIVLPIKLLANAKTRLAATLSPAERKTLVEELVVHQLACIGTVLPLVQLLIVTADAWVMQRAVAAGAMVVDEPQQGGLNGAIQAGYSVATKAGAARVLVLPVDLPLIAPEDIVDVLQAPSGAAVICADRAGVGTNLLGIPAGIPFTFQFGHQSFAKHMAEAQRLGLSIIELQHPTLQFDLDTPADYQEFLRHRQLEAH